MHKKNLFRFIFQSKFLLSSFLLLFFVVSLNPSLALFLMPNFFMYDIHRIVELGLLISFSAILIIFPLQMKYVINVIIKLPKLSRILLLIIFIIGLISALRAAVPEMAFVEFFLDVLLFYFAITVAAQENSLNKNKFLIISIFLICFYYSCYFFYSYVVLLFGSKHQVLTSFPGFLNLRFFSEFQIWSLAIISVPLCSKSDWPRSGKIPYFLFVSFWWALAFINSSKGLALSYCLALVVLGLIHKKYAIRFIIMQLFLIICGFFVAAFLTKVLPLAINHFMYFINMPNTDNFGNVSGSFADRLVMWKEALVLVRAHYLIGVGPMHYAYYPNGLGAHPHNAFLLVACEWGIPAALMLSFLIMWGLYAWNKQSITQFANPSLCLALSCSLIAGVFYSLCGGEVVTPMSQIMMFLCIGWALGMYQYNNKNQSLRYLLFLHIVFIFLLLVAIIVLVKMFYTQLPSLSQKELYYYFQHNQPVLRPRFWVQGWLH